MQPWRMPVGSSGLQVTADHELPWRSEEPYSLSCFLFSFLSSLYCNLSKASIELKVKLYAKK